MIKSAESVDSGIRIFVTLNDFRFHLRELVQTNYSSRLPYLDSFHLTHNLKIHNDGYDGAHFYSRQRANVGSRASRTVAALMLDAVLQLTGGGAASPPLPVRSALLSSLPSSLASTLPMPLPHTTVVSVTREDGELISPADKRHEALYKVFNGTRHAISNGDTFLALRWDWSDVRLFGITDFEAFPPGGPFSPDFLSHSFSSLLLLSF